MAWSEATRTQYGRPHDDRQDDLTDAAGALIPRPGRPRATDPRRVFDALRSLLSSGCRWRRRPPCRPPFISAPGAMTGPWHGRRQAVVWCRRERSSTVHR